MSEQRINIRVTADDNEMLDFLADKLLISKTFLITIAISRLLKEFEKNGKDWLPYA